MRLRIDGLHVALAGVPIVRGADLEVAPGSVVGLIGPNGGGKSTLLKAVYRHLQPTRGAIWLGDDDIVSLRPREAARRVAAVPQERPDEFDVTVREMVAAGRIPHKRPYAPDSAGDRDAIDGSLARVGMTAFVTRRFSTLSGGEKQRVLVARALAQATPLLVLDEPTNHLDLHHQLEVLELIRGLRLTTLVALHDLNLAATYCDRLYLLAGGVVLASGAPEEVVTPQMLRDVFRVDADVLEHPRTGRLLVAVHPLVRAGRADGLIHDTRTTTGD